MSAKHNMHYDCSTIISSITNATITKAHKRWRIAYIVISSVQAMAKDAVSKRNNLNSTIFSNITSATITKAHNRWRIAYIVISSVQAMAKEVASKRDNLNSGLLKPHFQTSPDIEPSSSPHGENNCVPCSFVSNIDLTSLNEMVKEKDLVALRSFGGVGGVATALKTDPENGIHAHYQEVVQRQEMFGANTYHKQPPKGLLYFVRDAFKDTIILILLVCAALSLGFGIKEHGAKEGWYEGGSIFVAVFIVVVVSALSNFRQEIQFDKLSKISNNIKVDVLRDTRRQQISIFDVVVGDVVFLNIGDQIPADGLFLDGHSLHIDESSMTGESDHMEVESKENPFLFSGSKVANGYARMLVTSLL